jgi:hypothetical protein
MPKHNRSAIIAPTASNDSSEGYSIGSEWFDISAMLAYDLFDASVGAAEGKQRTN